MCVCQWFILWTFYRSGCLNLLRFEKPSIQPHDTFICIFREMLRFAFSVTHILHVFDESRDELFIIITELKICNWCIIDAKNVFLLLEYNASILAFSLKNIPEYPVGLHGQTLLLLLYLRHLHFWMTMHLNSHCNYYSTRDFKDISKIYIYFASYVYIKRTKSKTIFIFSRISSFVCIISTCIWHHLCYFVFDAWFSRVSCVTTFCCSNTFDWSCFKSVSCFEIVVCWLFISKYSFWFSVFVCISSSASLVLSAFKPSISALGELFPVCVLQ